MAANQEAEDTAAGRAIAPTIDAWASSKTPNKESSIVVQTTQVGRFALIREIGSGGMGSVFAAYDDKLDRKVALKILRKAEAGNQAQRLRTLREARAAARISHPNVISVYEVGEADGSIHIAMEYVEGTTLLHWQAQGGRAWRDILALYLQVGEGLIAAHAAGVVHRDFKPDNVLIGLDGRPRVVDFGLARMGELDELSQSQADKAKEAAGLAAEAGASGRLTLAGVISGTPGYMSPEQYRGGDVDSSSDQWSYCSALFEALYGYLPFSGANLKEHAENVHGLPRSPPAGTKVPAEVHRALVQGLSPDPDRRFPSMAELLTILAQEQLGDVAAAGLSRKWFSRVLLTAVLVVMTLAQIRQSRHALTARHATLASVVVLSAVLIAGLWGRRTLLGNRFHRHMWILILIAGTQNLLQRVLAVAMDIPLERLFPFEMIVLAGAGAVIAATLIRWLFFVPALPLIACILSVTGGVNHRVLALVFPAVMILLAIGWSRAARALPHAGASSGPGVTPRGRRTPARSSERSSSERDKRMTPAANVTPPR